MLGVSKMLGVEENNEAKSHVSSSSFNATLFNPLMLAETLKGNTTKNYRTMNLSSVQKNPS